MYVSKIGLKSKHNFYYSNVKLKNDDNVNIEKSFGIKTTSIPLSTFKAYCNPEKKLRIDSLNIIIDNDFDEPHINIERITKKNNVSQNIALHKVYELVLNSQFHESDCYKTNTDKNYYEFNNNISFFRCFCEEGNFIKNLSQVKDDFVPRMLDEKRIKEALELAPTVLYVDSKNAKITSSASVNIGKNSLEDYQDLVKNITPKDVNDYHKNLIQNSEIKLTLIMNEKFYNENKNEINKSLIKNYQR